MVAIIIYSTDHTCLDRTIDDLLNHTPPSLIDEIIVCDDINANYARPEVRTLNTNKIGRAKAWNLAARESKSQQLVFIKSRTKFSQDWLSPLIDSLIEGPKILVSPVVHTLDLGLWMTETTRWQRFGWRWDLNLYDRTFITKPDSPAISSYCIACNKWWFDEINGFDDGMEIGAGEDIEISLRNWLFGGSTQVNDDSIISVALELDYGPKTINNLARIAEVWFPDKATLFYNARGVKPAEVDTGRLTNLVQLQEKQQRSIEWFLGTKQPELFNIYNLRGTAANKSVAVVGPGPSLDYLNFAQINRHDLIIGVDYVGLLIDCDFVITDAIHVVTELRKKYPPDKFLLPLVLQDRAAGQLVATSDLLPTALQFELGQPNALTSADPPLCHFDNFVLSAVQFALFLQPSSITIFGCDNKIIGDKSHTSKIEYYDGGKLWADSDGTRRKFAYYELGLDQLGRLAHAMGIPLLRVCHA